MKDITNGENYAGGQGREAITSIIEADVGFAHVVASRLNNLIDRGVLPAQAVSRASSDTLEEFVCRFSTYILHNELYDDLVGKVETLFGVRDGSGEPPEVRKERVVTTMRAFLRDLQEGSPNNLPGITGILLFGSSVDIEKTPLNSSQLLAGTGDLLVSDIDAIYITEIPKDSVKIGLYREEKWGILDHIKGTAERCLDQGFELDLDEQWAVASAREFILELTAGTERNIYPDWGFKPNSLVFIGTLGNLAEEDANKLIQDYLKSEVARKQKQKRIDFIKNEIAALGIS